MPATTATPAVRSIFADNVTHVNRSTTYFSAGFEQVRSHHIEPYPLGTMSAGPLSSALTQTKSEG